MQNSGPRYPQAMLVSCEIPWDADEMLMEDVFRRELRHVLAHFQHLYIFGTTINQFKGQVVLVTSLRQRYIKNSFAIKNKF